LVISLVFINVFLNLNQQVLAGNTQKAYFLDIGSAGETDKSKDLRLCTPQDRISEPKIDANYVTFRELLKDLNYFCLTDRYLDLNNDGFSDFNLTLEFRIKDVIPQGGYLQVGIKKGPAWNYSWSILMNGTSDNQWKISRVEFSKNLIFVKNNSVSIVISTKKYNATDYPTPLDWLQIIKL